MSRFVVAKMDNRLRDVYCSCNVRRIPTPVLDPTMRPVVGASICNRTRVPGAHPTHINHMELQMQSFLAKTSTAVRRGLSHDISGIFSRRGKNYCYVDPRHHSAHTTFMSETLSPDDNK